MERIKEAVAKAKSARRSTDFLYEAPVVSKGKPPLLDAHNSQVQKAWDRLEMVSLNATHLANNIIITHGRNDPKHTAFDVLRTKLRSVMNKHGLKSVAITSPTPDCGKSVISTNLAFSLAHQENIKTVLIDFDLKKPNLYKFLGIETNQQISKMFKGETDIEKCLIKVRPNLLLGLNQVAERNTSEIINWENTAKIIDEIKKVYDPDVIIFDLPPMSSGDDVLSFLPAIDLSMLVLSSGLSQAKETKESIDILKEHSNYGGVILNKSLDQVNSYNYYS